MMNNPSLIASISFSLSRDSKGKYICSGNMEKIDMSFVVLVLHLALGEMKTCPSISACNNL
eukprot:scaffold16220_cov110-Skeletonema_marinoi.AAC.1